ncbi:hypothetical protein HYFRA_00011625 [Hymenoscyphus fraxineus]|uniref:Uncharacterized protein n=1 Tax=Hymenoscyphus fraxineus TaxID=746836 RepID=A0A9N9KZV1_9HELO|nr:hypothetical protein HYFRA_00011625 [Hymenoscyphus fraxineus]
MREEAERQRSDENSPRTHDPSEKGQSRRKECKHTRQQQGS